MLDDTPTPIATYEFLCLSCPDPIPTMLTYEAMNDERPTCLRCQTNMVPNLDYFRRLSNAKMDDVWITPDLAVTWLENGFDSFRVEMSEATIRNYTNLMASGQWIDATKTMGGFWCPIIRVEHTLMTGFNRLQACINANIAFNNTVIEVI